MNIQKYVKGIGRRASIVFAVGVVAFVMTELYRSIYNLTDSTAWAIAGTVAGMSTIGYIFIPDPEDKD